MRFFHKAISLKTSLQAIRTNHGGQSTSLRTFADGAIPELARTATSGAPARSGQLRQCFALLLTTLVATSAIACGAADPSITNESESEVGQIEQEITGGSLVGNSLPPWGSAVRIGGCTGLKVGARWYLTATHCGFANGQSQTITSSLDGSGGTVHTLIEVANHPSSFQLAVNSQWWDLTLVRVDSDNAIPIHTPTYSPQNVGDTGYFFGYGCDNTGGNGGKKQFGISLPTGVPPDAPWPDLDPSCFYANGAPTVCPGDSGGPFFKVVNGQYQLAGMNRAVSGAGSYWNRIYGGADWINAVKAGLPGHNNLTNGNSGTFINMSSNDCLGSDFKQDACRFREDSTQRYFVVVSEGKTRFKICGFEKCFCLGPVGGGTAAGVEIRNVTCGTTESNWTSQNAIGQFRQYKNEKSGKCMRSTSTASGTSIVQGTCANTQDYYWVFSD
jgi:hypothetical protein